MNRKRMWRFFQSALTEDGRKQVEEHEEEHEKKESEKFKRYTKLHGHNSRILNVGSIDEPPNFYAAFYSAPDIKNSNCG